MNRRLAASALALALLAPIATSADATGRAGLLAHRAVYDIALVAEKSKGFTNAGGRIAFEFSGNACDGYALNFRQVTTIDTGEGSTRVMDMRSSTWEDPEGKRFRFNLKNSVDERTTQFSDGTAERAADGGVSIELKQPRRTKLDLPGEPVFPTEHTRRLLDAAQSGLRSLELPLYDGSDGGEKIFDTTSVIGRPIEGAASQRLENPARTAGFGDLRRWPISVSYFEQGQGDRVPIYTMSFDLLENGIYSNIRFDFGDFALTARMSGFETLKDQGCSK